MRNAAYWIEKLALQEHPEGGYFRQVYCSSERIERAALPPRFGGVRSFSTAIYFLLSGRDRSALHRIKSDELWHFYDGSPLTVHVIDPSGSYRPILLGRDCEAGQVFQAVVEAGCWFGATVDDPAAYALVGCTVAPGFDYDDFELADREALLQLYPQHRAVIERLT